MSDLFALPGPLADDIPLSQLHVWQWAAAQPRADVTVARYLASLGFVTGTHRLTSEQYDTLKCALQLFHSVHPHLAPRRLADAFPGPGDFYVSGLQDRRALAPDVAAALQAAGWVYDVTPASTYFQIQHGEDGRPFKVWARYQQIIGSRPLFQVLP